MYKILVGLLALLTLSAPASAELIVVTFPSGASCASDAAGTIGPVACSGNARIYQGYGDTSGVDFTYTDVPASPNSLQWWDTGYPGLTNVLFANDFGRIDIAPLTQEIITIESLDVASWVGVPASFTLRVLDLLTSAELYNSGVVNVGASSVNLSPDVSSANGLALLWDDPGQGKFGLDNITVSADPTPEPGTAALGLLGLGAIAVFRRRA